MENIILRGILFSGSGEIQPRDVGFEESSESTHTLFEKHFSSLYRDAKEEMLKSFNTEYIGQLLTQNDGNVTQTAQMCGLERQALQQIMRRYGIESKPYRK